MKSGFAAFALILLTALPAVAKNTTPAAVVYDCKIGSGVGSWITEEYILGGDVGSSDIYIMDGVVKQFNKGEALKAKSATLTDHKWVVDWALDANDGYGHRGRLRYHAVIFRDTMSMLIEGRVSGYPNVWTGQGTCRQVSEEELKAKK